MTTIQAVPSSGSSLFSEGVTITGRLTDQYTEILTPGALAFLGRLVRRFEGRRRDVLRTRAIRQHELDHGWLPEFPPETAWIREEEWTVSPIPADLLDRRVEISGPVDRRSVVTALNSGANLYMADLEDGNAPTWDNNLRAQINLRDAVEGTIAYEGPDGQYYQLGRRTATLAVRPRGLHLDEKHVLVDGRPISAALFDIGLFLFHNARGLMRQRSGPYFYLPKIESYFEARLWNDVFNFAQDDLGIPRGTVRATVIIETVLAAFQMDEILFELREHAAGLRHGRWDYIFSFIKKFRSRPEFVLPNRECITMDQRFLKASVQLMVKTCHRRGIHAIGGKATQDPVNCGAGAKSALFEEVMQNMLREVTAGHDGTQVVHPGLVPIAKGLFDARVGDAHQIDNLRDDVHVTVEDLLAVPAGPRTECGLRNNIQVTIRYLAAWLSGRGIIGFRGVMENLGTAEISRSQVWQWTAHGATLDDGRTVTVPLVRKIIADELGNIEREVGGAVSAAERYDVAAALAEALMTAASLPEFMTDTAYTYID